MSSKSAQPRPPDERAAPVGVDDVKKVGKGRGGTLARGQGLSIPGYKFTTTVVILSKQQSVDANFDCTPWLLKRLKTRRGTGRRTGRLHLAHLYKILAKTLRSDFSTAGCSKEARNAAWRSNSVEVSAVSDILRTEECQKHWHIIKSEARRNTRKQREAMTATDGGPPANPPLSQHNELI
ncbi:uncharacterized protein LOC123499947 [Portunus trituberculatus]|uniref:uncharacterized protein LOC123499947 n=1 Tax=Portunus trituberculatus TaxID=210409 RepID=UPI001E1CD143|nr:uncharacterized protein LOC123499947 [Portunus trituberculatus]